MLEVYDTGIHFAHGITLGGGENDCSLCTRNPSLRLLAQNGRSDVLLEVTP